MLAQVCPSPEDLSIAGCRENFLRKVEYYIATDPDLPPAGFRTASGRMSIFALTSHP